MKYNFYAGNSEVEDAIINKRWCIEFVLFGVIYIWIRNFPQWVSWKRVRHICIGLGYVVITIKWL